MKHFILLDNEEMKMFNDFFNKKKFLNMAKMVKETNMKTANFNLQLKDKQKEIIKLKKIIKELKRVNKKSKLENKLDDSVKVEDEEVEDKEEDEDKWGYLNR
jgi:hypothetical protein